MALTLAHVVLPLLVAMAVAAPLAEQTNNEEQVVNIIGDSKVVGRAKRAKEEIVFGNQQNGGRLGAAKKSVDHLPVFFSQQNGLPRLFPPQAGSADSADSADKTGYGFPPLDDTDMSGYVFPRPIKTSYAFPQPDNADKTGYVFAQQQQPASIQQEARDSERSEGAEGVQPVPIEGGQSEEEGEWQQAETKDLPLVPVVEEGGEPAAEEGAEPAKKEGAESEMKEGAESVAEEGAESVAEEGAESAMKDGADSEIQGAESGVQGAESGVQEAESAVNEVVEPLGNEAAEPKPEVDSENTDEAEDAEEAEEAEEASQPSEVASNELPAPAAVELEMQAPVVSNLPLDSQKADAEEALLAQDQAENDDSDDVESFLKELQENKEDAEASKEGGEEEGKGREEDEGSAEMELMQGANDNQEADNAGGDSSEYTQNLLNLLLHGGRLPVNYGYPAGSYYLQRRRRSLARRRLSGRYQRRSVGGQQLARSKRTKRDLFDDDLYYNQEPAYEPQPPRQDSQADLEELIAYLMALYPSLYDSQPRPRLESQYPPGYPWSAADSSAGYPEETAYPQYLEWEEEEEEPEYMEVPVGWEPSPQVPAWEPTFYPEELQEEPDYYPPAAKRQMMSMVPGQRRKRYFYPFAREPYTHWGAFVPSQEKRDYDEAYWRLKKLAMVLADVRQPSTYYEAFDDYKRK